MISTELEVKLAYALGMTATQIASYKGPGIMRARLAAAGLCGPCPRCGGTGDYGPKVVEGGRCFQCGGNGKLFPKTITPDLIERAEQAVAGGALNSYFQGIKDQQAARKGRNAAMKLWKSTGVGEAYSWHRAGLESDPFHFYHRAMSDLNKIAADAYDAVGKACDNKLGEAAINAELEEMESKCQALKIAVEKTQEAFPEAVADHERYKAEQAARQSAWLKGAMGR